eukprot:TRINITY_DN4_c0_g3_i1.p1 TRINITY_DN4_c0_g3~~TRINITY_DN4_c0_g3_i1.p1  ORF type:complete len:240 (+),score=51.93 TRINITY_DN4_c0_g3_i1:34-753(+)
MKKNIVLFCVLFFIVTLIPTILTQENEGQVADPHNEEEIEEEVNQQIITESPEIQINYKFTDSVETEDGELGFYSGEVSKILIGFTNSGNYPYQIVGARGGLFYNLDANYALENYTAQSFLSTASPKETVTGEYYFRPHPQLEDGEYGIFFQAYYSDSYGRNYTSIFFNETVQIMELKSDFDLQQIFQYGLLIALGSLILFGIFKFLGSLTGDRKFERGTKGASSEWLEGTNANIKKNK